MSQQASDKSTEEVRAWILSQVAAELGLDAGEIDVHERLTRYGMDSMTAVVLTGDLEHWLGRTIPPDLLGQFVTIESLAQHLTAEGRQQDSAALELPPVDEPELEPVAWKALAPSFFPRLVQRLTVWLVRLLIRIEVEGLDKVPPSGPFLLACNHLHILDTPVVFSVMSRTTVFFVSDHMLKFPLVRWYLRQLGQSIYVARGKADRHALGCALAALRAGETLVLAPEGRISRTGGLLQGQTGAAYLASRAGVPIVPLVIFGQEDLGWHLRRLRRARVKVRVGAQFSFPAGRAGTRQLEEYTGKIMLALARMLPQRYRGFYAVAEEGDAAGVSVTAPAAKPDLRGFTESGG
ncbi:MAG: 1-acyl-sn-glycerol-3-phosphate acyltransferase [Terriglobia bacterium]